jgi:hypothetical protein
MSPVRDFIRRLAAPVGLILTAAGCVHPAVGPGPQPPSAERVVEVRIESLPPATPLNKSISDQARIGSIVKSYAVAEPGWWEGRGQKFLPLYRIDFVEEGGERVTYWLGSNSHPGSFPCYAICSGWWIAPSSADGKLDESRYKGLTSTTYLYFLHDLEIP